MLSELEIIDGELAGDITKSRFDMREAAPSKSSFWSRYPVSKNNFQGNHSPI